MRKALPLQEEFPGCTPPKGMNRDLGFVKLRLWGYYSQSDMCITDTAEHF